MTTLTAKYVSMLDISENCFTDLGATAEHPFEPHFGHQRDRNVSAAVTPA